MLFNSLTFAVFFAIVLGLYNLPLPWTTKKINLLLASYLFYAAWSPPFVILLWISTAVDWKVALPLHPEYRTLPMVWYVPPLSPISAAANVSLESK